MPSLGASNIKEVRESRTASQSIIQNHLAQQRHLDSLREDLKASRNQCILAGHSLHDIDQALNSNNDTSFLKQSPFKLMRQPSAVHYDMLEIRKQTLDVCLLQSWSSTRDRINRWLLYSLRSDDTQAQLHRSMIAEQDIDSNHWAHLLLTHWYVDGAATGDELCPSLSIGAVDGHEDSGLESATFYTCATLQSDKSCNSAHRTQWTLDATREKHPVAQRSSELFVLDKHMVSEHSANSPQRSSEIIDDSFDWEISSPESSIAEVVSNSPSGHLGPRAVPMAIPFSNREPLPPSPPPPFRPGRYGDRLSLRMLMKNGHVGTSPWITNHEQQP
ncbi:hypothetical protein MMC28_010391 [Mycoblastus sanguinarius]|nr:hypothetical protein [Mycoblastus sanguinarius]